MTDPILHAAKTLTPQSDDFSYTVSDGKGGTASAYVLIRPPLQGTYSCTFSTAPLVSAEVSLSSSRDGNGKVTIDKKSYSFKAKFNSLDTTAAQVKIDKNKSMTIGLVLDTLPNGWEVPVRLSTQSGVYTGTCTLVVKQGGKK